MFIKASFVIDTDWKQSKGPSTGEWMNKHIIEYIHILEYYSEIKKEQAIDT